MCGIFFLDKTLLYPHLGLGSTGKDRMGLVLVSVRSPLPLTGPDLLSASGEGSLFMEWLSEFCVPTDRMR